jgi:hypothetical protein
MEKTKVVSTRTAPRKRSAATGKPHARSACKRMSKKSPLDVWAERIGWPRRVRAVCKPCWELKYCPYGPLVEDFPLKSQPDAMSCRIFGHDCPVFHAAEPFTETRELRNISRKIPRPVQVRVLKRENQVCRECGLPVQDDDIHFDHIIPFSKGGSSDESNIRLLCGRCNLKKGAKFEDRHLVMSLNGHFLSPIDVKTLEFLLFLATFAQDFRKEHGRIPTAKDIAFELANGRKGDAESYAAEIIRDLGEFFSGKRPSELKASVFRALKKRWGFEQDVVASLNTVATCTT